METSYKWYVIINPVAGKGYGLKDWPLLSKMLRDNHIMHDYAFTERKYHAVELAVEAVSAGYRRIIVVGGDGTIHEVVNGLFIQDKIPPKEVLLSVIAVGTGNDWIRMFGIPVKYSEAVRAIVEEYSFLQDVGIISYYESDYRQSRYMANVAGVGFDAVVNRRYNRLKADGKKGKWLYLWGTLKAMMEYSSTGVKVYVDDKLVVNDLVYSAAIGIGKYNGGGMLQTPEAVADDGLFDLTVIRKMNPLKVLMNFKVLFNGRIYKLHTTSLNRGRKIRIESTPEIPVEVDGEALGYSPFEFEMIDKAINVIVTEKFIRDNGNGE